MLEKYNIALIPLNASDDFICVSNKFSMLTTEYKLNQRSFPHITIHQFYANEMEVEEIWHNICGKIKHPYINLNLIKFSCVTFDDTNFWVSLIPDNLMALNNLHHKIAPFIDSLHTRPYDPHLTLISTIDIEYKNKINSLIYEYDPISDMFVLSIGRCDSKGQFTEIVKLFSI